MLVTGPVVLAELASYASTPQELKQLPTLFGIVLARWEESASFEAGKAYLAYRAGGGTRGTILADLLTGGHAAAMGAVVMTRDPRRFRAYFPELELIAPEADNG